MNVVMTGGGRFIEVQGTAEGMPFTPLRARRRCSASAEAGIAEIVGLQQQMTDDPPPLR